MLKVNRRKNTQRKVLSLFTGAGGLDLGLEASGFTNCLCVEIDEDARKTLRANRPKWQLSEPGDIFTLNSREILRQATIRPRQLSLLVGGPPCQPFSKASYWLTGDSKRLQDPRSKTLEAFLRVAEATLPRVILMENVKGISFNGKNEGLNLLERGIKRINRKYHTSYKLQLIHLNAANYGVPQFRERIFLLASIDGRNIQVPPQTHGLGSGLRPYSTSWDAIGDMDVKRWAEELVPKGKWADLLVTIPEGQNYLWHTPRNAKNGGEPLFGWRTRFWSFLLKLAKNQPSWTISAEPGPATGPFHWRGRLLSIQELCRLQTFPNGYKIYGTRRSAIRQVGNAVPSAIGELFGLEIRRQIFNEIVRSNLSLIPVNRPGCPPTERICRVPNHFRLYRAQHKEHPGPGLGPGAIRRTKEVGSEW